MIIYYLAAILATGDYNGEIRISSNLINRNTKAYVSIPSKQSPARGKQASGPTPLGSPGMWVTTNDYPSEALREERQGTVGFILQVDAKGKVSGCDINLSSGSPVLDAETCRLIMLRAQFSPALDIRGRPTASRYISRVLWLIPSGATSALINLPTPKEKVFTTVFTIKADGNVADCKTVQGADIPMSKNYKSPCEMGLTFVPYTNSSGKKVSVKIVQSFETKVEEISNEASSK